MSTSSWATRANVKNLYDNGYLLLSPRQSGLAAAKIEEAYRFARKVCPEPDADPVTGWGEFSGETKEATAPQITELLEGRLKEGIEKLFGISALPSNTISPQIAYQTSQGKRARRSPRLHVDGYPENDRFFYPQALLIGILLHNVGRDEGNFCFHPAIHMELFGRLHHSPLESGEWWKDRLMKICKGWEDPGSKLFSLMGSAGTTVILNPLTIHGTLENYATLSRIMAFFRVRHPDMPGKVLPGDEVIATLNPGWNGLAAILAGDD